MKKFVTLIALLLVTGGFFSVFFTNTNAQDSGSSGDNTQTVSKTEYFTPRNITSTATISGPITVPPGQAYNIIVTGTTTAGLCSWQFLENGFIVDSRSLVFGSTVNKTISFPNAVEGSYRYEFWFRGIQGAHTWPDYTKVAITVTVQALILPPNAPSDLGATAISSSQIDLIWRDNSDNEDGFIIEGKVNCFSNFAKIAKVGANVTGYSDKRALAGITHFYRVKASNEAGESGYSNIASATTSTPMDDIRSALDRLYQEGSIKTGLYNPLLVKIQAAQNAQNFNAALNQLNAFANQVQAQAGKGITTEASQTLLALNAVAVAYVYPDKIASGYALIATFKPADYPAVRMEALETPAPYEPYGPEDSQEYVGETTPGILKLYYYDYAGQCVNINRNIDINNTTRVIYYNGAPVTTLREIFGDLLPSPAGDNMYLLMDFPYWLTIFMTPATNNQTQPQIPKFKTDKETNIRTIPDGDPRFPDRTITDVNNGLIIVNGVTTTIGTLIGQGIITATAITPTDSYNCHGWTFTCGSGWITVISPTGQVERIISDNGYAPVTSTHWVHVGALAVYRNITGTVIHTGIVREVQKEDGTLSREYCNHGMPTLVESKWGPNGRYLHPPETVPNDILPPGGSITYYQPPNRTPPVNTGDPGKDQHTLKRLE